MDILVADFDGCPKLRGTSDRAASPSGCTPISSTTDKQTGGCSARIRKYPTDPKHDVGGDTPDGCTHVSWYTLDSWENDPYLVERSPERTARIEAESFRNMKRTGVSSLRTFRIRKRGQDTWNS